MNYDGILRVIQEFKIIIMTDHDNFTQTLPKHFIKIDNLLKIKFRKNDILY